MSESSEQNQEIINQKILKVEAEYCTKMLGAFTPLFISYAEKIITTFFTNTDFINQVLIPISEPAYPDEKNGNKHGRKRSFHKPPAELLGGYFARGNSELAENIATRLHRKQFTRRDFETEFPISTGKNGKSKTIKRAYQFYFSVLKPAMTECSDYLAESLDSALDAVGDFGAVCWLFEDETKDGNGAAQFLSRKLQEYNVTLSAWAIRNLFTYARNFRNQYTHDSNAVSFPGFHQKWMDSSGMYFKKISIMNGITGPRKSRNYSRKLLLPIS